jgi:hypothetical protein
LAPHPIGDRVASASAIWVRLVAAIIRDLGSIGRHHNLGLGSIGARPSASLRKIELSKSQGETSPQENIGGRTPNDSPKRIDPVTLDPEDGRKRCRPHLEIRSLKIVACLHVNSSLDRLQELRTCDCFMSLSSMNTLLAVAFGLLVFAADDPDKPKLSMSPAVACAKIKGFGDYVALDEPVLTRDDKLQVYYEPSGFAYETVGKEYRVHLTQEGRMHRRGQKAVIMSKEKLLDYQGRTKVSPVDNIYLSNSIALKSLPPGEYDFEIILKDELGKGPVASQILKFRVKEPDPQPSKP